MKHFLTICILLLCLYSNIFSQTEIWRFPGMNKEVRMDGSGNTYLIRGSYTNLFDWSVPDTLYKIDPVGVITWLLPLSAGEKQMFLSDSGIYLYINYGTTDTIFYIGTDGSIQWRYNSSLPHSPFNGWDRSPLSLDPSGNLFYPVHLYDNSANQLNTSLLKLDRGGNVLYNIDFPPCYTDTTHLAGYMGPYVTDAGNFWMILCKSYETRITKNGIKQTTSKGSVEASYFDGITGNLLLKKKTFDGITNMIKEYPDGRVEYTTKADVPVFDQYTVSQEKLVGWTTYMTYSRKCKSPTQCKSKDFSEWRVQTVDPQGKIKLFQFKGNGKWKGENEQSNSNLLYRLFVGKNNSIYLYGTMMRGKGNLLREDYALLKINLLTNKTEWKIIDRDDDNTRILINDGNNQPIFFHKGEDKIFSPIDSHNMIVINGDGKISTTQLNFTDFIWQERFSFYSDPIASANSQPGYLYAAAQSGYPPNNFGVKYSLPQFAFSTSRYDQNITEHLSGAPSVFSLNQNYPNPFNPATTIQFELASDALVTVKVYNSLGQEVAVLANREEFTEGANEVEFDGSALSSGIYFYRIVAEDLESNGIFYTSVKKMILMK
jgi:hypothetical protein